MNPRKKRYARRLDQNRSFKPAGFPINTLESNELGLDEFEALRLVDHEGKSQIDASEEMEISRATLQRLLLKARKKVVDSLLNNKTIEVHNEIQNIKLKGENNMDIESKDIKIIAFPSSDKVTIGSHFGKSELFSVYTVNETETLAVNHLTPPEHAPGVIPNFLAEHDVDVVITSNMGNRAIKMFETAGIDVILGAKGRIDVNLNEYLAGFLSSKGSVCNHHNDHHKHN